MSDFRRFWPYVNQQKTLYMLGFVGSLFRFLIPLSVPLVIKYMFDGLLQNEMLSRTEKLEQLLLTAAVMIAVFFLVRAPMEYVRQFFMHKANNNIIQALRRDVFRKIHTLDAKYLADNKSGEIGARFFDDIEKIRGYMTALFSNVWMELIVLIFVVGVMLSMNWQLTLLAVFLVGMQFLLAHWLAKRLKVVTGEMMRYRSVLSGFVFEKIQGAFVSKLFAAEKRDQAELDHHLGAYERLTNKQARHNALSLSCVNVLSDITPFLVVLAGCLYVIDSRLTLGSLIAFFAYVDRMRSPVAALVQAFPAIAEGSVALGRIFAFLSAPSSVREPEQPVELKEFADSIVFRNVTFSYNRIDPVINHMSFRLEKGKTYAFVGESGGGKSTILQLLTRMYDVGGGEVEIDSVDIRNYSLSSLRRHMGIVTQDNFLYSCSVKDNIRLAKPDASDEEIVAAAKKAFADDFIRALPDGYDTEVGERGVKLSGGQKQRIALARVFLKNPSIILLDEATSALDNESEKMVQESIAQIGRDKTIIMIAHRLSTVRHADKIFVIKNGLVFESGSHDTLMKLNGYYKELYNKQYPEDQYSAEPDPVCICFAQQQTPAISQNFA